MKRKIRKRTCTAVLTLGILVAPTVLPLVGIGDMVVEARITEGNGVQVISNPNQAPPQFLNVYPSNRRNLPMPALATSAGVTTTRFRSYNQGLPKNNTKQRNDPTLSYNRFNRDLDGMTAVFDHNRPASSQNATFTFRDIGVVNINGKQTKLGMRVKFTPLDFDLTSLPNEPSIVKPFVQMTRSFYDGFHMVGVTDMQVQLEFLNDTTGQVLKGDDMQGYVTIGSLDNILPGILGERVAYPQAKAIYVVPDNHLVWTQSKLGDGTQEIAGESIPTGYTDQLTNPHYPKLGVTFQLGNSANGVHTFRIGTSASRRYGSNSAARRAGWYTFDAIGVWDTGDRYTPPPTAAPFEQTPPKIWGVHQTMISDGQPLNLMHGIEADDLEDGDLSNKIRMSGHEAIDYTRKGSYPVTYEVTDSHGATTREVTHVIVEPKNYPEELGAIDNQVNVIQNEINRLPDEVRKAVDAQVRPHLQQLKDEVIRLQGQDLILQGDLNGLNERLRVIGNEITGLGQADNQIKGLTEQLDVEVKALGNTVKNLENQINTHTQRLKDLEDRMFRLEDHLASTRERIAELEGKIDSHQDQLNRIADKTSKEFLALKTEIEQAKKELETARIEVDDLTEKSLDHTADLDALNKAVTAVNGRLNQIDNRLANHNQRLAQLENEVGTIDGILANARERIAVLEERTSALQDELNNLSQYSKDQFANLLDQVLAQREELEQLSNRVTRLEHGVDENGKELKALDENVKQALNKLIYLESATEQNEKDLARLKEDVNQAFVETKHILIQGAKDLGDKQKDLDHHLDQLEKDGQAGIQELKQQTEANKQLIDGLVSDTSLLEKDLDKLKENPAHFTETLDKIKADGQLLDQEIQRQLASFDQMHQQTDQSNEKLLLAKGQLLAMNDILSSIQQDRENLEKNFHAEQQNKKNAQVIQLGIDNANKSSSDVSMENSPMINSDPAKENTPQDNESLLDSITSGVQGVLDKINGKSESQTQSQSVEEKSAEESSTEEKVTETNPAEEKQMQSQTAPPTNDHTVASKKEVSQSASTSQDEVYEETSDSTTSIVEKSADPDSNVNQGEANEEDQSQVPVSAPNSAEESEIEGKAIPKTGLSSNLGVLLTGVVATLGGVIFKVRQRFNRKNSNQD